jgi:uncharacterized membrane protein YciS (DUF1049 family)
VLALSRSLVRFVAQAKISARMDIAALFIVGIACALVGWAIVYISAQIEQRRAIHQLEKYGASPAPNTSARNGEPGAPETDVAEPPP